MDLKLQVLKNSYSMFVPRKFKGRKIIRCMGALEIEETTSLSSKTLLQIISIVEEQYGGLCYLAHITDENGILNKGK